MSITEITARAAAARYAAQAVAAAGAEERIAALQQQIEEQEYLRILAETQLDSATWPEGVGTVMHIGTDEPGDEVLGLVDIYSGKVYLRQNIGESTYWVDPRHGDKSEWPIIDSDSGPFIRLKDDWYLHQIAIDLAAARERRSHLINNLGSKPGFHSDSSEDDSSAEHSAVRAYELLAKQLQETKHQLALTQSQLRAVEQTLADTAPTSTK